MQELISATSTMPNGEICEVADSSNSLNSSIDACEVPAPARHDDFQRLATVTPGNLEEDLPYVKKGVGNSNKDEVKLWRSSIAHLYGNDWETALYALAEEDDEDGEAEHEESAGGSTLACPGGGSKPREGRGHHRKRR